MKERKREIVKWNKSPFWTNKPKEVNRLEKERKGEIAFAILKAHIKATHQLEPNTIKRELGNLAKKIGIELEELKEFSRECLEEIFKETLEALAW